jgi:hypothetical protein
MSDRVAGLAVERVAVTDLATHPENPRKGDLARIADSLVEHGQYKPIVVQRSTGYVLAGNHTFLAARRLGWSHVEAVFVDVDDDRARRILLVDNRTSDLGEYDADQLVSLLGVLPDLTGTGYTRDELDDLITERDLPTPVSISTHESEGERVTAMTVQWGYLGWGRGTRVQITAAEVEALDTLYAAYVERTGGDTGFGYALTAADQPAEVEAAGGDGEPTASLDADAAEPEPAP